MKAVMSSVTTHGMALAWSGGMLEMQRIKIYLRPIWITICFFNKLPRTDSIEVWEELFCDVQVIMVVAILRTNGIFNFSSIKEN